MKGAPQRAILAPISIAATSGIVLFRSPTDRKSWPWL